MTTSRAQRRRAEILAAAHQVFETKGYHSASIADIAAVLGIGHGTFYRYFENKLDIFRHVIERVIERIAGIVAAEDPEASATLGAYRAQVERIGRRLYEALSLEPGLARLLFIEAPGIDEGLNARLREAFDLFARYTQMYLLNGQARGFLRGDLDTQTTALAINAMIFEGARRVLSAQDGEAHATLWTEAVMRLMFEGMGVDRQG